MGAPAAAAHAGESPGALGGPTGQPNLTCSAAGENNAAGRGSQGGRSGLAGRPEGPRGVNAHSVFAGGVSKALCSSKRLKEHALGCCRGQFALRQRRDSTGYTLCTGW